MQSKNIKVISDSRSLLTNKAMVVHTEEEYEQLVTVLDNLVDEVGENEDHPLASLMEEIGVLIESYENQYIPELTEDS